MMGFGCICFENLLFRFAIIVVGGGGSVFSEFLNGFLIVLLRLSLLTKKLQLQQDTLFTCK